MKNPQKRPLPLLDELLENIQKVQLVGPALGMYRKLDRESSSPTWGDVWIEIERRLQAQVIIYEDRVQIIIVVYGKVVVERRGELITSQHLQGVLTEILRNEYS